jgi:GNAT superfamily N-acetyltransferase
MQMMRKPSLVMQIRGARATETDDLARIWHDGWQDAHAKILPPELARHRTLESFRHRLQAALPSVRVADSPDSPAGFCMLRGDEVHQLYVSSRGRGIGLGGALLGDAEAKMSADGVTTAWLACAIGNERAAMFYQAHGWTRSGTMIRLDVSGEVFELEVWRFEKDLSFSLQQ